MIGFLQGRPLRGGDDSLVLLVGGVGYEIHCAPSLYEELKNREEAALWIYTHVREDQITLYGFSHPSEKKMFLSLLKVNGVGPKLALGILSSATLAQLKDWISEGDVKALTRIPKVGKRTAEQVILGLKGQLPEFLESQSQVSHRGDLLSALVNLGFRLEEVQKVVSEIDPEVNLDTGIRMGLAALTR